MKLLPKNWEKFQHYKHRSPPWIKLHRDILDDFDWWSLPIASRAIAPCLWLLASCEEDGEFDASPEKLAFRFRMTEKDIQLAIKPLIDKGYFICASDVLAPCYQDAMSEKSKSREEKEKEKEKEDSFDDFWKAYPKKVGKDKAIAAWGKKKPPLIEVLEALQWQVISEQWKSGYIPNPATYINDGRWQDEPQINKPQSKSFKEDTMAAARSIFTNSSGIPYYQAKEIEVKNDE